MTRIDDTQQLCLDHVSDFMLVDKIYPYLIIEESTQLVVWSQSCPEICDHDPPVLTRGLTELPAKFDHNW